RDLTVTGVQTCALPILKGIEDAIEIRRRVLIAFEAAEREPDAARRAAWLSFVIVGGGPTGVELAGAFAEIARQALPGDFRHIDQIGRASWRERVEDTEG